MLDAIQ
jgi:hypothetical protein